MTRADVPGLWDYAVALYERPGVAEAALTLQDSFGADVNVVLLCLWLAQRGLHLEQALPAVLEVSARWQASVVQPLRQCRRSLKTFAAPAGISPAVAKLRETIKAGELEAERLQMAALSDVVEQFCKLPGRSESTVRVTAEGNLAVYFAGAGLPSGLLGGAPVMRILDGAFGR